MPSLDQGGTPPRAVVVTVKSREEGGEHINCGCWLRVASFTQRCSFLRFYKYLKNKYPSFKLATSNQQPLSILYLSIF
jgi:hypothetical protein